MTTPYHPLQTMLDCAVPLEIAALESAGGPDDADIEAARAFGRVLAARGDVRCMRRAGREWRPDAGRGEDLP